MKTILEILNLSTDFLKQKKISNPRRQAENLLSDALGMSRLQLYVDFERPLTEPELDTCRKNLARRSKGEPLQYIKGFVEFCECTFIVNPHVLIPRQETEILVEMIAKELEKLDLKEKVLWDVCCGSGCIGISLKKRFPELNVILSDISPDAIKVAQANALKNEVDVKFFVGDLLEPLKDQKADFFACNPPYISQPEFAKLDVEVKQFEPTTALISGPTGLEFYERLARDLPALSNSGLRGWMELGTGQGERVLSLFSESPWKNCRYEPDWSGHDRFFFLEIE